MVVMRYQFVLPEDSMRKLEYDIAADGILVTKPGEIG